MKRMMSVDDSSMNESNEEEMDVTERINSLKSLANELLNSKDEGEQLMLAHKLFALREKGVEVSLSLSLSLSLRSVIDHLLSDDGRTDLGIKDEWLNIPDLNMKKSPWSSKSSLAS